MVPRKKLKDVVERRGVVALAGVEDAGDPAYIAQIELEVMDVDGPTGGYNLTPSFAPARKAVTSIRRCAKP